jgi:hypothetical protein
MTSSSAGCAGVTELQESTLSRGVILRAQHEYACESAEVCISSDTRGAGELRVMGRTYSA